MYKPSDYIARGYNFLHNHAFPHRKRLSSLMLYTTDLCDSACKHCLIWAKRPPNFLSLDTIKKIMAARCVNMDTVVGLEGGEFLLHPEATEILGWFSQHHPNFDIFSNCLKPDKLIDAVKKFRPKRLYISLDGGEATYRFMRGKDGYNNVLQVIDALKGTLPVFVMFTLSPYNDYDDLQHVAELCQRYNVFLRVGIYNNIPFFDTIDDSRQVRFGQLKDQHALTYSEAVQLRESGRPATDTLSASPASTQQVPTAVKDFKENAEYIQLYQNWRSGQLRLRCHSILDSVVVLPNGDVPICQSLELRLGNIYEQSLDDIFNGEESVRQQVFHSKNCNQCWTSYHRKYDIVLYRGFEKYFGRWATSKMLGYYKWGADESASLTDTLKNFV